MAVKRLTKRSVEAIAAPAKGDTLVFDDELHGFGVRVYPSGKRVYVAQYAINGRTHRLRLGVHGVLTAEEARKLAKLNLLRVASGADPAAERDEARALGRVPTFSEFVETWKEALSVTERLRERTRRDYLDLLKRYAQPAFGRVPLDEIRRSDVEAVLKPLLEKGKRRTARLLLCAVRRIFDLAFDDEDGLALRLRRDPCARIKFGSDPAARHEPLTAEERAAFRAAIRGTEREPLWLAMMLCGLNPSEALGLGWEHLDLSEQARLSVVRVLDTQARVLVNKVKRPKRRRDVPIPSELRPLLRERWLAAGRPRRGLVFTNVNGGPLDLHLLRRRDFADALKAAGITRRVFPYLLRHGFGTIARESGIEAETLRDLMGHSSIRTTLDVYAFVTDARKRRAANEIAEALR
jgi:integrase